MYKKEEEENTLDSGIDYFQKPYTSKDVHDVSTKYSRLCPCCGSHNLHLLGADSGSWDWALKQCKECGHIFVYGWAE